jgi:hypothetical protein
MGQQVVKAEEPLLAYHHLLEDCLRGCWPRQMQQDRRAGLFVHWGVYYSCKSTAARRAGLRLQAAGRTVILLQGCNGLFTPSLLE